MSILYVVSDRAGAGKTAICAALVQLLRGQGKAATAFKPIATPNGGGNNDDGGSGYSGDNAIYAALLGAGLPDADAPSADDADAIAAAAKRLAADSGIVVVEAAEDAPDARITPTIADAMDARILLVVGYEPALDAAEIHAAIQACGDRLAGCVINGVTQYMGTDARTNLVPAVQALAGDGGAPSPILGVIPEDRRLLGVSVRQLAAHLDGELIHDEDCDADGLVEYLMVGGMGLDPGDYYYRIHDNRAAIVRGDRPDLQMSALSASGRTACIVATNGVAPIEYVRYEAELEETPIVVVQSDTLTTMDRLDSLVGGSRFDHPLKLERCAALLEERLDLPRLLRALGG